MITKIFTSETNDRLAYIFYKAENFGKL